MGRTVSRQASRLAVLNANYIRERLKDVLHLAFDRPCMHECVFSDQNQQETGITTLEMAKRLMDYGYHPPTIYFPLVVHGAIMIEPTETETKEDLDGFIEAFRSVVREAAENPELLREAPYDARSNGSTRPRRPGTPASPGRETFDINDGGMNGKALYHDSLRYGPPRNRRGCDRGSF